MPSAAEVASHNSAKSAWIIIKGNVYDITKFADEHPGGKAILLRVAGRDVSKEFDAFHNADKVLKEFGGKLIVGPVGEGGASAGKSYTAAEVAKHNKNGDAWVIIGGKVYDVTKFVDEHPGGKQILMRVAGRDVSKEFDTFHNADKVIKEYGGKLLLGNVAGAKL